MPPTIIVMHPRERRRKCTVWPLRGRDDLQFVKYPAVPDLSAGYVRLGLGGPILSPDDADRGLLILDGTWKLTAHMQSQYGTIPVRSLPPLRTAYPRVSKVFTDPAEGLATVEALYAAYRLLGRDTAGLLDHYHWADEFLRQNGFDEGRCTSGLIPRRIGP